MKSKIVLKARYGYQYVLERIKDNKYGFVKSKCSDFLRVILAEDDKTIDAIDPPGGPMLWKGEEYDFGTVRNIESTPANSNYSFILTIDDLPGDKAEKSV